MTFLIPWLVIAAAAFSPGQEFDRGRTAFQRGEYERAVTLIYPLVYPELRLESENEVLAAHRFLGVSYLFINKPADARIELRKLLELSPDFRFDPLLDPPRVVEFFNALVREQQDQLGDIEARLKKREEQRNRHVGEILVRRVEHRSYALNFIPLGVGQFQNEQRTKGWAFFGVEAGLAAISLGAFITNFAVYGASHDRDCNGTKVLSMDGTTMVCPPQLIDRSKENTSKNLIRLQVASGAAFFAVTLWGLIDAVRNFRSDVPLGESYIPANPPPQPGAWRLTPVIGPLAQGGALTVTF